MVLQLLQPTLTAISEKGAACICKSQEKLANIEDPTRLNAHLCIILFIINTPINLGLWSIHFKYDQAAFTMTDASLKGWET